MDFVRENVSRLDISKTIDYVREHPLHAVGLTVGATAYLTYKWMRGSRSVQPTYTDPNNWFDDDKLYIYINPKGQLIA